MDKVLIKLFGGESLTAEDAEKRLAEGGYSISENSELETIRKTASKSEELRRQLEKVSGDLRMTRYSAAIDTAIAMAGPRNLDAAKAVFKADGIINENGIDEDALSRGIEKLRKDNGWLFERGDDDVKLFSSGIAHGRESASDVSRLSDEEYYGRLPDEN